MAITKKTLVDQIEVLEDSVLQVRTATVLTEDDAELSRNFHRHTLMPSVKTGDTWGDTDISGEDARVQAVCNAVWTDAVKKSYQDQQDANAPT